MELTKILSTVDHTLLAQGAAWEEIRRLCDDGMEHRTASVCIPPSFEAGKGICGRSALHLHRHRLSQRLFHHGGEVL